MFKATIPVPEQAFDRIRAVIADTKRVLSDHRALMTQASVSVTSPLTVIRHIASALPILSTLSATPGLAVYAKSQVDDPTYDIAAEYVVVRNAMQACMDNLVSLFPKDASSWLLYQKYNVDGTVSNRTFTAAQMATALPFIDQVIAAID